MEVSMDLMTIEVVPATFKSGHTEDISVSAGKSFKIETSPQGETILDEECPAGKSWSVRVIVEITETDA